MSDDKFSYKYSAPTKEERNEIEDIQRRYKNDNQNSKIERLRKLDAKAKNPPIAISVTMGIVGILVFGLGLTMILEWAILIWGIVVMLAGSVVMGCAYPCYSYVSKTNKKKYGSEILKLSEELLNSNENE